MRLKFRRRLSVSLGLQLGLRVRIEQPRLDPLRRRRGRRHDRIGMKAWFGALLPAFSMIVHGFSFLMTAYG